METWPKTREDAGKVQEEISRQIVLTPLGQEIHTVAGIDASYVKDKTIAAISVFDYQSLECIGEYYHILKTSFPYIPGYLSFREARRFLPPSEK